jgi:hypothetical protein
MSGLKISFTPDMPAMAVEVVSPDFQVVDRLMLSGGQSRTVEVPSEASFLRMHLPSGGTVTVSDPGNLDRTISRASLALKGAAPVEMAAAPSPLPRVSIEQRIAEAAQDLVNPRDISRHHILRAEVDLEPEFSSEALPLGPYGTAYLTDWGGRSLAGEAVAKAREARRISLRSSFA